MAVDSELYIPDNLDVAHAGGSVCGHTYTNSIEAVRSSIQRGFKRIELDVVTGRDGFLIAHDGMESSYGVTRFDDVSLENFRSLRVYKRYTPVSFDDLQHVIEAAQQVDWVFDTKFSSAGIFGEFVDFLNEIRLLQHSQLQVYTAVEAQMARGRGVEKVIFALWKKFGWDSLGAGAFGEFDAIRELSFHRLDVSLSYRKYSGSGDNFTDPRFSGFQDGSVKVLFHNFPSEVVPLLKEKGYGLFAA